MKLLAQKSASANGGSLSLMKRDEHYKIANLAVPLPTAMTARDFESKEMLLISHPGWRRCSFGVRHTEMLKLYYDTCLEGLTENKMLRRATSAEITFLKSQFIKLALLDFEPNYFHEELQFEMALEFAAEKKMPVVITAACIEEPKGSTYAYRLKNDFEGGYSDYLNVRLAGMGSVYVIPTKESAGVAVDEQQTTWQIANNEHTWEGECRLLNGEVSSKMFGRLTDHEWETIWVGGGAIGHCLNATLAYFLKNPSRILLVDDFCYTNNKNPVAANEEVVAILRQGIRLLGKREDEKKVRERMFKLLRGLESDVEKIKEYLEVIGMFNESASRKRQKEDSTSRIGVVAFYESSGPHKSVSSHYIASQSGEISLPSSEST